MANPNKVGAFASHARRYDLLLEFRDLQAAANYPPPGVYVIPSAENVRVWYGLLFIHSGEYLGAMFRFQITFPEEYPYATPSVRFLSDVYHPLVNSSGHFVMHQRFPSWRPHQDFVANILQYISASFIAKEISKLDKALCPNVDALTLFESDKALFDKMARNCVDISLTESNVFGYDSNGHILLQQLSSTKYSEFSSRLKSNNIRNLVSTTSGGVFSTDLLQDFRTGLSAGLKFFMGSETRSR